MKRDMGFDFFGELPREITIDILSRLPFGSILRSKLASNSKACRDAVKSPEFVVVHRSKHETFFVEIGFGKAYKLLEEYGSGTGPTATTICRTDALAECTPLLPYSSSVMGLMLFLCPPFQVFSICNPVTREYVIVPLPMPHIDLYLPKFLHKSYSYGFGVSKKSKQYKLVHIFGCYGCQVYTLGTGKWRVGPSPPIIDEGPFFSGGGNWASRDGKLYWVKDMGNICSFDLESEVFTTFSALPCPNQYVGLHVRLGCYRRRVCVLEESLCVCDSGTSPTHNVDDMLIWIMRGEGDWTLKCRIPKYKLSGDMHMSLPIKELGNIILMASREGCGERYCYDIDNTSTTHIGRLDFGSLNQECTYACRFNPTFDSLKTLFHHQGKDVIHTF